MSAVGAFMRRDAQVALSYRVPFALDVLSTAFVLLTFAYVGRLVPDARVDNYFTFVTVGLALSAFLQAGLSVVAGTFRQEQVQGTLETTLSTGLPPARLAAGMAAYPLAYAAARVVVFAILAGLLGARAPGANWGLAATAVALASLSFAGLGLVAAALVVVIRQAEGAAAFGASLLGLAAGALFPPELLPGWARALAQLSPLTHALRLSRDAILSGAGWADGTPRLLALAGLATAFAAAGVAALALSLRRARRRGGLAEY